MVCRWWNTAYDRKNMIFKYLVILFSTTFQFSYKLSYLAMSTFNKAYWWCRRIDWDCFVWWICLWIINTVTRFIKKSSNINPSIVLILADFSYKLVYQLSRQRLWSCCEWYEPWYTMYMHVVLKGTRMSLSNLFSHELCMLT